MKLNINQVLQIEELCEKFSNRVINARVAYKFAKLSKSIINDIDFYREQYALYVNEFGQKDDRGNLVMSGNNIKIVPGLEEKCKQKFNELNSLEVDLPEIKFSLNELESIDMTMKDILILDPFIEE